MIFYENDHPSLLPNSFLTTFLLPGLSSNSKPVLPNLFRLVIDSSGP